ncbi:hypothetical protein GCM10023116_18350 [Kistimonas scapharcae]|uniref:Flagellar hook-length control protein-like C-terminal domain-containing protein n=1 Tax=Kistimonas scapharcae TaxID=1036133 RepID=A0ABP8V1B7_9GAMM
MEGSTVTDSSLLPISMPVPLQQPPVAVNGTESSTQTLTFADLFSRMMSTEASLASGELQLATDIATPATVLPETSPVLTQLQAAPGELSTLPALLQSEGGLTPLAQALPDVAATANPGESAQTPVAEHAEVSERLPALISEILSQQQTMANKSQAQKEPSLAGTDLADDVMLPGSNAITATKLQKPLLQGEQPVTTGPQGTADAEALPLMPEPSRVVTSVQVPEGTVELEQGVGRATSAPLAETTLQARPVETAVTAAGSVTERAVSAAEAPASPTVVEKPVTAKAQLEPAGPGQLGDRIMVMINRDLQQAQIRMDPPELGHLKIALAVDGDQVSVQFTASQPGLRELIIQQTDRLRQHLESQQLNLVSVDVSTDQGRDPRHPAHEYGSSASVPLFSADVSGDEGVLPVTVQQYSAGLLDVFA